MVKARPGLDARRAPWRVVLGVLAIYAFALAGIAGASVGARSSVGQSPHAFALCAPDKSAPDRPEGIPDPDHTTCCLTGCMGAAHPAAKAAVLPPTPIVRRVVAPRASAPVVPATRTGFLARGPPPSVRSLPA